MENKILNSKIKLYEEILNKNNSKILNKEIENQFILVKNLK